MHDLFRIADQDFSVASSYLEAYVANNKLCWGFVVQAASSEPQFERWEPRASSDIVFESRTGTLSSWRDLAPAKAEWVEKNDTDVCPSASLYVFEHAAIYDASAELYENSDQLRLALSGKCDVNYQESYFDKRLDLAVDVAVSFQGVYCGRRSKSEAEELVSAFLPLTELVYTRDGAGVAVMVPRLSN